MKKPILWAVVAAVTVLILYFVFAQSTVLPWMGEKVAAILVGAIAAVAALFGRKKRSA
ncbi:MAG: hypothetical protein ABIO24_13145 [Saprospiraceae bacterium]